MSTSSQPKGVSLCTTFYRGQFVRPHAIKFVNPDPPATTLILSNENGNEYSSSCPLTTPMSLGSPFHHPKSGPPELPGVMSAYDSISSPPLESPSSSTTEIELW